MGRLSEGAARRGLLLGLEDAQDEAKDMAAAGVEQEEGDWAAAESDPAVAVLAGGEGEAPDGARVVAVDFEDVVSRGTGAGNNADPTGEAGGEDGGDSRQEGVEVHDVCRCFLASLMLANAGAVRLCHPGAADRPADSADAGSKRFRGAAELAAPPSSFARRGQFRLRWTGRGGADDGIEGYRAPSLGLGGMEMEGVGGSRRLAAGTTTSG